MNVKVICLSSISVNSDLYYTLNCRYVSLHYQWVLRLGLSIQLEVTSMVLRYQ